MVRPFRFLIIFIFIISSLLAEEPPVGLLKPEQCIPCHKKVTPQIVKEYGAGAMGKVFRQNKRVPKEIAEPVCADCHGTDHTLITRSRGIVAEDVCGSCHNAEYQQHIKGGHTSGPAQTSWENLITSKNYLLIPPVIRQSSCEPCHSISGGTDRKNLDSTGTSYIDKGMILKRNGCDECHTRHKFNLEPARKPEACMTCHAGEHSSAYESYLNSHHGAIYRNYSAQWDFTQSLLSANYTVPTCAFCHMLSTNDNGVELTHNMEIKSDTQFITLCSKCHETKEAERVWSELKQYKNNLEKTLIENEALIDFLRKNKLIDPKRIEINELLRVIQNEGNAKNIPCLPQIVSAFNSARAGFSHSSSAIAFAEGIQRLNQSLVCFENWYATERTSRRLNIYVKIALLLGVLAVFLILIMPRKKQRRSTIEF